MARGIDVQTEARALRRAELLLVRVREDCGPALTALQAIEPLLTRIDRAVVGGGRPELVDIDRLASAGQMLDNVSLHSRGMTDALRHDLALELREIADRLRPEAVRSLGRRRRASRDAGSPSRETRR